MADRALWERYKKYLLVDEATGFSLDISRMNFSDTFFRDHDAGIRRAFDEMDKLEAGAIANPDEKRMVGHYWLRDSSRAPNAEIKKEIDTCLANIKKLTRLIHSGKVKTPKGAKFKNVLVIGIGGSAL